MSDAAADQTTTAASPLLDPLAPELVADRLLASLRETSSQSVFDWPDPLAPDRPDDAALAARKAAADLLVKSRLVRFDDDSRSGIAITNAGRYWALHGGYLAYLKEEPSAAAGGGRQRNSEMEALRAEYMKLRLDTFWWSFGLSISGFVMSIISVIIAIVFGDRVLR